MSNCHPARVIAVERLSPNMARVTLAPVGDWTWVTDGIGDERIDLAFPRVGETEASLAFFNQENYGSAELDYSVEPPWRHYTVRQVRAGGAEFDIDFVLHEGGHASDWALRAEPGHVLGVFGAGEPTRSHYRDASAVDWQLLVADATGLPGLGRIVEELQPGQRAHAIVEVISDEDRQEFETRGELTIEWLAGSGMGLSPSRLADAVRALEFPEGTPYVWVACEAATSRAIRSHLRRDRGLARDTHSAIGYWSAGKTGHVTGINAEAESEPLAS